MKRALVKRKSPRAVYKTTMAMKTSALKIKAKKLAFKGTALAIQVTALKQKKIELDSMIVKVALPKLIKHHISNIKTITW